MLTPQVFSQVTIDPGSSTSDFTQAYQVFVSNDATNWGTPVASGTGASGVLTIMFPTQNARYVGVVQTGTGSHWWSISEFNVYGPGATPTVQLSTTGWVASASVTGGSDSASRAIDGDLGTRWSTGTAQANGQWFRLDMLQQTTVTKITLNSDGSSSDYPRGYQVYVSNSTTNWGTAVASGSGTGSLVSISIPAVTGRYLKIVETASASNWWSIAELQVFGIGTFAPVATALPRSGWIGTASSVCGTDVPTNAFDDSAGSRWSSGVNQGNGQYFQIDMLSPRSFTKLTIDAGASSGDYPRAFSVYATNDTNNWGPPIATGHGSSQVVTVTFAYQTARYIKILLTGGTSSNWWSIHELNVYGLAPQLLLKDGWNATASLNSSSAPSAIDGKLSTRWTTNASQSNGQWFQLDMLAPQVFNQITLDADGSSSDYPRGYQVFASNSPTSWGSPIATGSASSSMVSISFDSQNARYIRIVQTGATSSSWSIAEINVYNVGADPALFVRPVLDCVADRGGGNYTAVFGYSNATDPETSPTVSIPYGSRNQLSDTHGPIAAPQLRPPTLFAPTGPGEQRAVLSLAFTTTNPITWTLNGASISATPANTCPVNSDGRIVDPSDPTSVSFSLMADGLPPLTSLSRTLGTSLFNNKAVGDTPGSFDVTGDGAATYHLPIWVPHGRAGVEPNLSLDYNSRSPDGPMGVGWTLSGMSQITRCPRTIAEDGISKPILYSDDDALCLDGKRLVPMIGPTGAQEYRTRPDAFIRIIPSASEGPTKGPASFTVLTKDGSTLTYGGAVGSARFEAVRPTDAAVIRFTWAIRETRDAFGNAMRFNYTNVQAAGTNKAEYYPTSIDYTFGNATSTNAGAAVKRVEFVYVPTLRKPIDKYRNGIDFVSSRHLSRVDVKGPDPVQQGLLRTYGLTYRTSQWTGRDLLSTVSECDGSHACKAPTLFNWDDESADATPTFYKVDLPFAVHDVVLKCNGPQTFPPGPGIDPVPPWPRAPILLTADFDGDGFDDILYRRILSRQGYQGEDRCLGQDSSILDQLEIVYGQPNGVTAPVILSDIHINAGTNHGVGITSIADFNSDGKTDILMNTGDIFLSNGRSFTKQFAISGTSFLGSGSVDLDGDGRQDFMRVDAGQTFIGRNNGTGAVSWIPESTFAPSSLGLGSVLLPIPGVRQTGLTSQVGDQSVVAVLDGQGVPFQLPSPGPATSYSTGEICCVTTGAFPALTGDFNGDGLEDHIDVSLLQSNGTFNVQNTWINTGTSWQRWGGPGLTGQVPGLASVPDAIVADVDGDGRDDVVFGQGFATFQAIGTLAIATPEFDATRAPPTGYPAAGGFTIKTLPIPVGIGDSDFDDAFLRTIDLDGNGITDFLTVNHDSGQTMSVYRSNQRLDHVVKITSPLGAKKAITYSPLTLNAVYTQGTGCQYPEVCIGRGPWVVYTVADEDPVTGDPLEAFEFRYSDGRTDVSGLGFRGFAQRKIIDFGRFVDGGQTTITLMDFDNGGFPGTTLYPLAGLPKKVTVDRAVAGGTHLVTTTSYTNTVFNGSPATNSTFAVGATTTETVNSTNGYIRSDVRTVLTYDGLGLGTLTDKVTSGLKDGTTFEWHAHYAPNDSTSVFLEAPFEITETDTVPGDVAVTRTTDYSYEPGSRAVKTETREPAGSADLRLVTTNTRNAQGLVERTEIAASGETTRVTTLGYDKVDGTLPAWTQNSKGHSTLIGYHHGLGQPTLIVAPDLSVSSRQYDGFGRLAASSDPSDTVTIAYEPTSPSLGVYQARYTHTDGRSETVTRDSRDRESVLLTTVFDGESKTMKSTIARTQFYDNLDRPTLAIRPAYLPDVFSFVNASQFDFERTTYDAADRVVRIDYPDGTAKTVTYSDTENFNRVTFTDESGHKTFRDVNERGLAVATGSVLTGRNVAATTRYGAFNNPTHIFDPLLNETVVGYDIRGRRTSLREPNLGESTYTLNAFGDLRHESGPGGHEVDLVPDELGRTTREISSEDGETQYLWDVSQFQVGRLGGTITPSTATKFDYLIGGGGKVTTTTESVGGKVYQTGREYDSAGRLSRYVYPEYDRLGVSVDFTYLSNGDIGSIKRHETQFAYWTNGGRNADRQFEFELLGNGLSTQRLYYPHSHRLNSVSALAANGTVAFGASYNYYPNGNVKSHGDSVTHMVELFGYDELDRLTSWQRTDGTTETYGYDDIGNLTKVDLGKPTETTYVYGQQAGPHALTSVHFGTQTTAQYQYDARGLQTSGPGRNLDDFTSFRLPRSVTMGGVATSLEYDGAHRRVRKASSEETVVSIQSSYEWRSDSGGTNVFYIPAPNGFVAQVEKLDATPSVESTKYLHSDPAGSVLAFSTTASSVQRIAYDPFGKPVDTFGEPTTTTLPGISIGFESGRKDIGPALVDLGGRLYDPGLRRFTSPDALVSDPGNPQAYNRYAYALNNPLRYADPSGFAPVTITYASSGQASAGGGDGSFAAAAFGFVYSVYQWATGSSSAPTQTADTTRTAGPSAAPSTPTFYAGNGPTNDSRNQWTNDRGERCLGVYCTTSTGGIYSTSVFADAPNIQIRDTSSLWELASKAVTKLAVSIGLSALSDSLSLDGNTTWGRPDTLTDHYVRHGADVGATSQDGYAKAASDFFVRSQSQHLPTKIDAQGIIRVYDPDANLFGAFNPDGTSRTIFSPTTRDVYWDKQPGVSPWEP